MNSNPMSMVWREIVIVSVVPCRLKNYETFVVNLALLLQILREGGAPSLHFCNGLCALGESHTFEPRPKLLPTLQWRELKLENYITEMLRLQAAPQRT